MNTSNNESLKDIKSLYNNDEPHEDMSSLAALLKKHKMKTILDHGCGSGRNTVYLAKEGFRVFAIDNSSLCLENTAKFLKKENVTANLVKHDFFKGLPYDDNSLDAVISIRSIGHNSEVLIKEAIEEIYRIMKPGGYFYLQTGGFNCKIYGTKLPIFKKLSKNVYIQTNGFGNGSDHYLFTSKSLRKMLHNFKISYMHTDKSETIFSILAQK